MELVKTSYREEDVTILLKDISGLITPLPTEEREKLNQSGIHYSEMLPLEYKPTEKYMEIYNGALQNLSYKTANATAIIADKLYAKHGKDLVLVSLARAGTPIGILIKRFIMHKYDVTVPHYSISIIPGKGIDINAMNFIVDKHGSSGIQFVDGWVGKGAINAVLVEACKTLKSKDKKLAGLDSTLAVRFNEPERQVTDSKKGSASFTISQVMVSTLARSSRDMSMVIYSSPIWKPRFTPPHS